MKTKEKIIVEALNLFSIKGFSSVSVRDIASSVGIKASSLYNHFENKQDIFDTIVNKGSKLVNAFFNKINITTYINKSKLINLNEISDDDFFNFHFEIFRFYFEDKFILKFRKMLEIERFNNHKISVIYKKIFIDNILDYECNLFSTLIQLEIIKYYGDPHILALQLYSPFFLLLFKYEKLSDEEIFLLRNHVIDFKHNYQLREWNLWK